MNMNLSMGNNALQRTSLVGMPKLAAGTPIRSVYARSAGFTKRPALRRWEDLSTSAWPILLNLLSLS